jgi:hypothetical protein
LDGAKDRSADQGKKRRSREAALQQTPARAIRDYRFAWQIRFSMMLR